MKIIVCLDDKNGMLFNKRRQSSDRLLRERVLHITAGARLWMNAYSAKQFADASVLVDEHFLLKAKEGDYCFVEDVDATEFLDIAETVIVYRWNTVYPSDTWFPAAFFDGKAPQKVFEFIGNSHKRITEEIYER